jgi:hypothetical protein
MKKRLRGRAATADRHSLYELSVQDPPSEVEFTTSTFLKLRRRPAISLREDFCGTAVFCLARRRPLRVQVVALFVGAVGASLAAEVVHLLHHVAIQDAPDHGGFWTSAVLVGLINAIAMLPFLGAREFQRRRTARQASAIAEGM